MGVRSSGFGQVGGVQGLGDGVRGVSLEFGLRGEDLGDGVRESRVEG